MKVFVRNLTLIGLISSVLTLAVGLPSVAKAETINGNQSNLRVKRVAVDAATGNSSTEIPTIELSPGYGVNISFIKTGEIVEKVWLDNPAIASLDVDGCLSGIQKCEQEGATILHLRRINPLNVPQLPKTSSSLLTVVAKGNSGRRVYLFRVAMSDKAPKYHTIEVTSDLNIPRQNTEFLGVNNVGNLQSISRGLKIAQQQGLISPNSPLWMRIENFFTNIQTGESISSAAGNSGISIQLVNRLIQLGTSRQQFFNRSR
jgi:hypothetical protein